jgi:4-hydroxy-3-methylbut-2-enyl diphosphate reductase
VNESPSRRQLLGCFTSELVARIRRNGNVWDLPGGQIRLPRVFGFCRGVTLALASSLEALHRHHADGKRLVLLGEIIHNPWVNEYFQKRGVRFLSRRQRRQIEKHVGPEDCAIIPAFGVPVDIEKRLRQIGCEIVDAGCSDVRRLWNWAAHAAGEGYAVLIFGRSRHDETIVTKSRLEAEGGQYVVVGDLDQVRTFCRAVAEGDDSFCPADAFGQDASNAQTLAPLLRLAQVSQTTMLYGQTLQVRRLLEEAFASRFGGEQAARRLLFQPTVCRATQDRQTAAEELCATPCDVTFVVGGIGSSNSRHLLELAAKYCPAYFIEDAQDLLGPDRIRCYNFLDDGHVEVEGYLPDRRPVTLGVLAGASSPEIVVGGVLERLASFLR